VNRAGFACLVAAATAVTATLGAEAWHPVVRAVLAGASVGLWLTAVLSLSGSRGKKGRRS
jgi:hypothetical protein